MSNGKPQWQKHGQANRTQLDPSALKRMKIPSQEFSLSRSPHLNLSLKTGELELSEHLTDLWVVLRKVAKTIFITIVVVLVLPGYHDGVLSYEEPLVLQILNSVILYSLKSISAAGIEDAQIFIGSPMSLISLYINLAFYLAILLSIPFFIKEVVDFIKPGLSSNEYNILKQVLKYAVLLFMLGAAISYYVILPIMLKFLIYSGGIIGDQNLLQLYSLSAIISLLLWGTLGGGILYASPMILVAMVNLEIIEPDQLRAKRKEIILAVMLLSALITVDPTILSMIILTVPMIVIIEIIIAWSYKVQLKRMADMEVIQWL